MNLISWLILGAICAGALIAILWTIRHKAIARCSGCTGSCSHCSCGSHKKNIE